MRGGKGGIGSDYHQPVISVYHRVRSQNLDQGSLELTMTCRLT